MSIFAQYRVLGLLGRGGMGSVYLAEQTGPRGFCRQVVLKFIRFDDSVGEERRRRLGDEAQLTALVDHPNVVKLLEVKEHEGKLFMALERVGGINFSMLRKRVPGGRLPAGLAAALMAQVCDGLHAIHETRQGPRPLNIIHRDVTPMNLMLDTGGRVRVIDLGIARADVRESVTAASQVQGNLAYMAPEQWNGLPLDRTVDVYSAALVFYELCAHHPFQHTIQRSEVAPLRQHCPEVTPDLSALVGEALALDAGQRPPQISLLGRALADYARGAGFPAPAQIADYFADAGISLAPPEPRPLDPRDETDWRPSAPHEDGIRPVTARPSVPAPQPSVSARPATPAPQPPVAARPSVPASQPSVAARPSIPAPRPRIAARPVTAQPQPPAPQPPSFAAGLAPAATGSSLPVRRPPPPQPPESGGPRIILNERSYRETSLPDGRMLLVYTTWLDADTRGPRRLALSTALDLLPGPLFVAFQGHALSIHGEPGSERSGRTSLYLDAYAPATRLEQILLGPGTLPQSFDYGHRRHVVRRIAFAEGRRVADECILRIDDPPLTVVGPRDCARLVVLTAADPDYRRIHLEALCIRPS